jgi:hypothetical protein
VEAHPLAFVERRLDCVDGAGGERERPALRRADRGGEGDVEEDEDGVVAQAVKEAAEGAGRPCGAGDHAVQPVRDQPQDAEQEAGRRQPIPVQVGEGGKGAEQEARHRDGVRRDAQP